MVRMLILGFDTIYKKSVIIPVIPESATREAYAFSISSRP